MTKVVFYTGGVYSSVGKGLTLANIGRIFKELGFKVSALKLDPYLNIDSGNLSPVQHGEVFVTADGLETDLDLGHYERFMDYQLSKHSCITAGKIYERLLKKQRSSNFTGETVQVIPHMIDEIHNVISELLSVEPDSDFLFIEIGGTVGDLESIPFIEAAYRFKRKYGDENVLFIHISPIFYLNTSNEFKTKPTQHSLKQLLSQNIFPDLLILRSPFKPSEDLKKKFLTSTQIDPENIIYCLDSSNIYLIAENLYEEKIHERILSLLKMPVPNKDLSVWKEKTKRVIAPKSHSIKVAIVGKYSKSTDAYISITESFKLASYQLGIGLNIDYLTSESIQDGSELEGYDAVCVPYGFGSRGTEGKIKTIEFCRKNKIPFLGICFGMQLACIEYMRNALNCPDCDSTEINPDTANPLFIKLPVEVEPEMRLGNKRVKILKGTKAYDLYSTDLLEERHRHRYYLNPDYLDKFKGTDFVISAFSDDDAQIAEIIELKNHPFFMATQFHPEFDTKFLNISPIFLEFLRVGAKI